MVIDARRIEALWRRLAPLPGGGRIFGWLLGRAVPYSGSIRPRVLELEPGRAVVAIRDRRRLRNHFRSLHALALANVAELAAGLAMTLALPAGTRGIPVRLEMDYLKKARGRVVADGRASPPRQVTGDTESTATAELSDEAGDVVARGVVIWQLTPREP
ncbi:MAG: DUF4442 domain-containing protein [Gemmatimonadetes bacterium]|nr:DUF4442 domain-containing protein [Gemmatimonadota bacterium]NIQ54129.1 DUF4442 domain-containing protein [Gemmatimonadota bacterium]NIU74328.1 DUF4442 domain-containing protein [Gammaproteobacteria bacterium]NIX44337.1 DUF4442 domain-containing protein [Gemmatimonadota bacterium]NIY08553.1 DUF4442 domain-containing protein [Gemmatimonadota bacterium]